LNPTLNLVSNTEVSELCPSELANSSWSYLHMEVGIQWKSVELLQQYLLVHISRLLYHKYYKPSRIYLASS
jgi:hypothetical protein